MAFFDDLRLQDFILPAAGAAANIFFPSRDRSGRVRRGIGSRAFSGFSQGAGAQSLFNQISRDRRIGDLLKPESELFKERLGQEIPQIETDPGDLIVGTRPETKPALVDPGLQPLLSRIGGMNALQVALRQAGESLSRERLPTAESVFSGPPLKPGQSRTVNVQTGTAGVKGAPFPKIESPLQASQRELNVARAKDFGAKRPLRNATLTLRKAQTDAAKALSKFRENRSTRPATLGQLGTSLRVVFEISKFAREDDPIQEEVQETIKILIAKIREFGGSVRSLVPELGDEEASLEGSEEAIEATAENLESFESAEDVFAAINNGAISKAEGRQILMDEFGFSVK